MQDKIHAITQWTVSFCHGHPVYALLLLFLAVTLMAMTYLFSNATRPPHFTIQDKVFIVTGGSSGVGLATALLLVTQGARSVAIVARNEQKLRDAKNKLLAARTHPLKQYVFTVAADVSNPHVCTEAVNEIVKLNDGRLDALICCAGTAHPGRFLELPVAAFKTQMEVNYLGTVYCARAAAPHLYKNSTRITHNGTTQHQGQGGRILITSSMAGLLGMYGYTAYSPTKFALRGFAEALHAETLPHNVYVSLIVPPDVDTPGYRAELAKTPRETRLMSQGTGVFTAKTVAASIIAGLQQWRFFISTGMDGWLVSALAGGAAPSHSSAYTLLQCAVMPIARFVMLGYGLTFYNIVRRELYERERRVAANPAKQKRAGAAQAAAPAPATATGRSNAGEESKKRK